ncbi:hypothetical protein D3C76_1384010 [compost metagenome]
MQLGARANVIVAQQGRGAHGIAISDFFADIGFGQQYTVFVVMDRPIVGKTRVTVIAIAVFEDQVTVTVRADFLTALFRHQHGNPAIFLV